MRLGIIGAPGTGKTTLFRLLTGHAADDAGTSSARREPHRGVARIADCRLETICGVLHPKQCTPAELALVDMAGMETSVEDRRALSEDFVQHIEDADAFLVVLGAFSPVVAAHSVPEQLASIQLAAILADLEKVEKRIERIDKDVARGKKEGLKERELMDHCREVLSAQSPLREMELSPARAAALKGFSFMTLKPQMLIFNLSESQIGADDPFADFASRQGMLHHSLCAEVEAEIAALPEQEQKAFWEGYGLEGPSRGSILQKCLKLLDLVTFFTVEGDEVRAWNVPHGTHASEAAGRIHSDMAHGFVRAEVVEIGVLVKAGSMAHCRQQGLLRLEGKEYPVRDGDILTIRFTR